MTICGQFMIIWHMTNLPTGVSMVDSIVQCAWMNMMHLVFSTAGKSISLIAIEDSFPSVTSSGVTKSHLRKARVLEKRPPKRNLGVDIVKMLGELKKSEDGGFEGYGEKHNWTHKSCL
jgi:hypothetical protein